MRYNGFLIPINDTIMPLASRHQKTLADIFHRPTSATIKFSDIEKLVVALGGAIENNDGSRMKFCLNGHAMATHRPHPNKEAKRYQVEDMREFLQKQGITP